MTTKGSGGRQSSRSFKEALLTRVRREAVKEVRSGLNPARGSLCGLQPSHIVRVELSLRAESSCRSEA